jgi:hypothetical protein
MKRGYVSQDKKIISITLIRLIKACPVYGSSDNLRFCTFSVFSPLHSLREIFLIGKENSKTKNNLKILQNLKFFHLQNMRAKVLPAFSNHPQNVRKRFGLASEVVNLVSEDINPASELINLTSELINPVSKVVKPPSEHIKLPSEEINLVSKKQLNFFPKFFYIKHSKGQEFHSE